MRLRTLHVAIVSVVAAVLGNFAFVSPASAAAPPTVVSPAPGGTLPVGSAGPLVIDFPTPGEYLISVDCGPGSGYFWYNGAHTHYSGRQTIPIKPLVGSEELSGSICKIELSGGSPYAKTTSTFTLVGSSTPVVVSPPPGGTMLLESTGPLVIDFPIAASYSLSVICGGSSYSPDYSWSTEGPLSYSAGRHSIPIDPLRAIGKELAGATCQFKAAGESFPSVASSFTVVAVPLALGDLRVSASTFYPLVNDGYLDTTRFLFVANRFANATLMIQDSRKRTVFTDHWATNLGAHEYWWEWGGRTTGGKPVLPGAYTATLSLTTADGGAVSRRATVRVVTKTVTRRKTVRRSGNRLVTSTSGSCDADKSPGEGTVLLDCRGGAYAAATYTVKLPADATKIRWRARTNRTDDDVRRGTVTKRGTRVDKAHFQVRVQATGWRAVEISEVWISYRGTYQI